MNKLIKGFAIGALSLASLISGCSKKENQNLKYLEQLYMEHYDLMQTRRYSYNRTIKEDSLMGVKITNLVNYYKSLEERLTVEEKVED